METEKEYMVRVSKFIRSGMLMAGGYEKGRLMSIECPWQPTYLFFPRKSVSQKWIYGSAFRRRVWRSSGFTEEPYTEYGTAFDIIRNGEVPVENFSTV
jgi:hypothetical protein